MKETLIFAWINLVVLVFSSLLFLYFYIRSVSPATLEKILGPGAYARCGRDRIIASLFEMLILINYFIYFFHPLPVPLPDRFPWDWWVSILIAFAIAIPSITLMVAGLKDAGEEALHPRKEHGMFGGIYTRIRHPQAAGEVFLWWVFAFLLNSPFLVLFSFIFIPIFIMLCFAEEQDLLWRYGDAYADYCKRTGAFFPRKER